MHPVVFNATLEEVFNLIGTFVFAVSGALLAVRKDYDIVGMAVLAVITAIGGGVIRDLVIGAVPPAAFTDAIPAIIGSAIVVIIPHLPVDSSLAAGFTAILVFTLRLLALRFGWKAPQAWHSTDKH
jgi:uncharacterized membrane protein YeiH